MKVFKYKVIKVSVSLTEAKLNEFGRRGYELVSALSDDHGYTYYFKVEIENNG